MVSEPKTHGLIAKLAVTFVAILIGLALCERTVRWLDMAPAIKPIMISDQTTVYRRSTNPILGFELKANYRNPDADKVISYPSTNAYGQRDVERNVIKPPGVQRIIVLGDSVVEGMGIAHLEQTITAQLEQHHHDGNTEVLNFGVSGYCTLAEIELLETKGLQFEPDIVILVFLENDFRNFNVELIPLGGPVQRPALVKWLFLRSHLFRLTCVKMNLFFFGTEADPVNWNKDAMGDNNVVEGLERYRVLAHRHEFKPLIAIWPRFTDSDIVDVHFMPNGTELVIERLAQAHGLPTVRLSTYFKRAHSADDPRIPPSVRYTISADQMHPNPLACRIAGAALKEILDSVTYSLTSAVTPSNEFAAELAGNYDRTEPTLANAYYNLGFALHKQGRIDEAIQQLEEALQLEPEFVGVHLELGIMLAAQGKLEQAIDHFSQAVKLAPDHAPAVQSLANALHQSGRNEEAIKYYQHLLQLRPRLATARQSLVMALLNIGRPLEARSELREGIRLNPNSVPLLSDLAWLLSTHADDQMRNPQEAIRLAQRAAQLTNQQDATVLDSLAAAYATARRFDEAVTTADAALILLRKAGAESIARLVQQRRQLYLQGKPFRESTPQTQSEPKSPTEL